MQEARAKLSTLIESAMTGRPQQITRGGKEAVIVVSVKDYRALSRQRQSVEDVLRTSPLSQMFGKEGIPEWRHKESLRNVFI